MKDFEVCSWNEWDPLETVIVGRATGARLPNEDPSLRAINYAGMKNTDPIPSGPYPTHVIEESEEDLSALCAALKGLGVTVLRPDPIDLSAEYATRHWRSSGYYSYCPRDSVLVHGNKIIECPMPLRARYFETESMKSTFLNAMKQGAAWISAPKPLLLDESYRTQNISKDNLTLLESEPCFDAANVLRCGRDLFYLVSNSGNRLGAHWLQNLLGHEFQVHVLEKIYSYMHIDSTISFLRPGLVLLNPSRLRPDNLPAPLKNWDVIWCPEPIDIGHAKGYCNASTWIGMNLLMVRPDLAIVEKSQGPLIRALEQKGIEVLPLSLRHARTLGGSFHCVTLDLKRKGVLDSYF